MIYLNDVLRKLSLYNLLPLGSSDKEIAQMQLKLGYEFPLAYVEFLQLFGESSDLFGGDAVELLYLEQINKDGAQVYQSAIGINCPSNIHFMYSHQCYSFYYFYIGGNQDPVLFLLVHGDEVTNKMCGTISELVQRYIQIKSEIKLGKGH